MSDNFAVRYNIFSEKDKFKTIEIKLVNIHFTPNMQRTSIIGVNMDINWGSDKTFIYDCNC